MYESWSSLATLAAFAVLVMASNGPVVDAATFTVDSGADAVDVAPGDGVCATAGGTCTLRAAIQEANALAGADAIELAAGQYVLALPGVGDEDEDAALRGDLDITDDLTIEGVGADVTAVDANGINRVFQVLAPATVEMRRLTIRGGRFDTGAGVLNQGTLMLSDVRVAGNNGAPLDLTVAPFNEIGCKADGAGISNTGTLTLRNVSLSHNKACGSLSTGGGLENFGDATLTNVTVSRNRAAGGGGIINWGTLALTNVTIVGNKARASGCLPIPYKFCTGGGLLNGGTATLTNVTIVQNRARGPRLYVGGGVANVLTATGLMTFVNTIVAGNGPLDCYGSTCFQDGPGCIVSHGHNLRDADGSYYCPSTAPTDLTAAPLLGPVQHGGILDAVTLRAGSPAIDAGDDTACPATDELGQPRPADGDGNGVATCDIGAYEVQP